MTITSRRARRGDSGSGAIALILAAILVLVVAGFFIDTGRAIHQRERASDVAEQAARYAANHISADALRAGAGVVVDTQNCTSNVQAFVLQSGFADSDAYASECTAAVGNTVSVRVRLTYHPLLMKIGNGDPQVWGHATAQAVQEH
ncbi:pilus assembly protein TadG-related protein [Kitasatospora paracochleata]|uniref:Flp pilus assembly protein TadG n=1 Tax=Kitasatospora paracochleata TaxID=58354 RepID=A0ABT1JA73_9ACTN|nr:pilus assembly protein TadG-related protein [Kitasatospora paracochleata]MCP2313963.1 Flp pilus assembly protein TadG [Kitasatospora paracochleata]